MYLRLVCAWILSRMNFIRMNFTCMPQCLLLVVLTCPSNKCWSEKVWIWGKCQVCRYIIQACFVLQVTKLWGKKAPLERLVYCSHFMPQPVTCPESPALRNKSWNNVTMLRMRYVAVHGYIVMTNNNCLWCVHPIPPSLIPSSMHTYAHKEGAGLPCHPCQPIAPVWQGAQAPAATQGYWHPALQFWGVVPW